MADTCPTCGKTITGLDREVRFKFPQPVADILHDDPESKRFSIAPGGDFIRLDSKHVFVRVLLPVQLDIGHEFHFGVWMSVNEKQAQHLWDMWDEPEYLDAKIRGHLASLVPPWDDEVEGADCTAEVRDKTSVPFITESTNKTLFAILTKPWAVHECEAIIERLL